VSFEERIVELGIEMPRTPVPVANYVPAVRVGNLIFASGQTPTREGVAMTRGKVGAEVTLHEATEASAIALMNCLAEVRSVVGTLDTVDRIVKLTGYVASAPGFDQQPLVINGASLLLEEIFAEAGKHARVAIGVAELPGNAPVEVDLIVAVRPDGNGGTW
jgi:enamine deaminase RidA (YjgF/YER057c/UK114 family)